MIPIALDCSAYLALHNCCSEDYSSDNFIPQSATDRFQGLGNIRRRKVSASSLLFVFKEWKKEISE